VPGVMTLDEMRKEWPVLRTVFLLADELYQRATPESVDELGFGPTFDELLDVARRYVQDRVVPVEVDGSRSELSDLGIMFWRHQALDILDTAIRGSGGAGLEAIPILGTPAWLDTASLRRFQWTGIVAEGKRAHSNRVPCHTEIEKHFAEFLDEADGVARYLKNERLGFSVTYYENGRPRQYYPDFIVVTRDEAGQDLFWLAETKGEIRPNTALKSEAARLWCEKMSETRYGKWNYLFVPQRRFYRALAAMPRTLEELAALLSA